VKAALAKIVRITIPDSALWRVCEECGLLAALPPEVDRCERCQPQDGKTGRGRR
jgi:hypothetical protein